MKTTLFPIILCAAADATKLAELNELATIVVVEPHKDGPIFRQIGDEAPLSADVIYRDTVGFMVASVAGMPVYDQLTTYWLDRFGAKTGPVLVDLTKGTGSPMAHFAALSAAAQTTLHDRNTRLMREIGILRSIHDTTLTSFEQLETFMRKNGIATRHRTGRLDVQSSTPPYILQSKDSVSQRLPQDSAGLCDVAINVAKKPRATKGHLRAELELVESGELLAAWTVDADTIEADWLRFSLDRALPADPQTVVLHLSWDGDAPLALASSHFHPDPRFMPRPNTPLLALNIWKYVPGARPTLTTDAVLQSAPKITNWILGRGQMQRAVGLGTDPSMVSYSDAYTGLMVQAVGPTPTVARLRKAARRGVQHLFGGVKNEDADGPVVEFAYGVAPARGAEVTGQAAPTFAPDMVSEWLALKPSEWAEVHLLLPAPLTEDHDLYLMTRVSQLAKGETLAQPPQSCFYGITGLAEVGAKSDG
jgi:hypothetical protein